MTDALKRKGLTS